MTADTEPRHVADAVADLPDWTGRNALHGADAAATEDRLLSTLLPAAMADSHRQCERLRHALQHMHRRLNRARAQLAEARQLACLDALTGLPNRRALDLLAGHAVRGGPATGLVAVLFIDLDGFKHVNDRLGHVAGDELLRVVGRRLARATRRRDSVYRVGGDEFVCVLLDLPDPASAHAVAVDLVRLLATPCDVGGERVALRASIGIAVHAGRGADMAGLYRRADGAMYAAKALGGGRVEI